MKRCPKCKNDFSDDANFCPVDAGHLIPIEEGSDGAPAPVPLEDTGGHELLDGRFALGDSIAGHRTGLVYQAEDKEGSSVIVKVVDSSVFPTALLKQRTERELAQLQNLKHENVAQVLGHGRREDSIWIASEEVQGVTLQNFVVAEGKLSQSRSLKILRKIGGALEAAAKLGVTHRDLSPKNIMVGEGDQIKIINFGVPVPGSESNPELQGVAEYIAPEQFEGRPVDQRSNIYSLGAIAYLLLDGKAPFSGSIEELKAAGTARTLGEKDGVSDELSTVLLKSLEKSSSKRFMTLRQFIGGLEQADGETPTAKPATGKKKAHNPAKTLMGLAPITPDAAQPVGTPAPAGDIPDPGGTADYPAAILRRGEEATAAAPDSAETTLDHKAPEITPALIASAQATAAAAAASSAPTTVAQASPASPETIAAAAAASAPAVAQPVPAVAPQPSAQSVLGQPVPAQPVSTPVPAAAGPASRPSGKGAGKKKPEKKSSTSNKGKFRETMWFKKGELDEAAAKAAANKPEDQLSSKADEMEMDERYKDDGSITQTDKERLSLQTGATMMMEAIPAQAKQTSNQVSEADLVSEMTSGRNTIIAGIAAAAVVIGVIVTLVFVL